ncbi:MAG: hypothetical protein HFJ50_06760 [Clostridia bacterium]|nr:hypothetical protein [Clostridia bacterium]
MGELENRGTITMTARGTYNQVGENVYLWKNINDTFEYVPAVGGAGAPARNVSTYSTGIGYGGVQGTNGTARSTGGGGSRADYMGTM